MSPSSSLTDRQQAGTLVGIATLWQAIRYVRVTSGSSQMAVDAMIRWQPLAAAVLSGTPLYTGRATDNKPPLWQFQQVFAEWTGQYFTVNIVIIGLSNIAVALLIWHVLRTRTDSSVGGFFPALLYLFAVPMLATAIGNKNTAVLFVLMAVFLSPPLVAGVAFGIGGLFAQQAVLATPVIAWFIVRRHSEHRFRALAEFVAGGAATVLVAYGLVAILWGPQSAIRGFELASGLAGPHAGEKTYFLSGFGSDQALLVDPSGWLTAMYATVHNVYFLVVPALVGAWWVLRQRLATGGSSVEFRFLAVGALLSLSLLIRGFRNYWVLFLPSLGVMAAVGYRWLVGWSTESQRPTSATKRAMDRENGA